MSHPFIVSSFIVLKNNHVNLAGKLKENEINGKRKTKVNRIKHKKPTNKLNKNPL